MADVTKVSEINKESIAEYLHLADPTEQELKELNMFLEVSKSYIKSYTGQKDLDIYQDFIIAVYILCQDMYDNRALYIEKGSINNTVSTILDMHSVNLIWSMQVNITEK